MAYLFVVENNVAKPNVETLLVSPFKEIWNRDTSVDKSMAIKEFTFMEFMSSKKKTNPFKGYPDDVRFEKLQQVYFNVEWRPDILIEQGLAKIVEFQKQASPTYSYYVDNLEAAEKTRKFLKEIDLSERNEKTGNPIYKPKDVTSALIDSEKVILALAALGDKVEQELFETTKTKNNKTINPFEI